MLNVLLVQYNVLLLANERVNYSKLFIYVGIYMFIYVGICISSITRRSSCILQTKQSM